MHAVFQPSRRPPSQGKWGPLGCSPPGVLWAPGCHGSSPRLCSPCGLAHCVASSGAAHLFGPRPPLAPPSRARLPFRRPLSQGKWRLRPRPRTFFFSLRRRYRADEGGGLPPKPGKPAHRTQDQRRTRTKAPSTDAKAEVWSSGAGSGPDPSKPPHPAMTLPARNTLPPSGPLRRNQLPPQACGGRENGPKHPPQGAQPVSPQGTALGVRTP
jgi:hypothetical protein